MPKVYVFTAYGGPEVEAFLVEQGNAPAARS